MLDKTNIKFFDKLFLTLQAQKSLTLHLSKVWSVGADSSYQRKTHQPNQNGQVLLRTFRGSGRLKLIGKELIQVLPSSLHVFNKKEIEAWGTQGTNWRFAWFEFETFPPEALKNGSEYTNILQANDYAQVNLICDLLSKNNASSSQLASTLAASLFLQWTLVVRKGKYQKKASNFLLEKKIQQMQAGTPLSSIPLLAQQIGLSERQFRRVFTQQTGLAPKAFALHCRMEKARSLLEQGLSPKEVAIQLKFISLNSFSQTYKRHFGLAPSHQTSLPL